MGRRKLQLPEVEICQRYLKGETIPSLSGRYGCSGATIFKVLERHNIKRRTRGSQKTWDERKRRLLVDKYKELGTYEKVGELYGVSRQRVHQIITGYRS